MLMFERKNFVSLEFNLKKEKRKITLKIFLSFFNFLNKKKKYITRKDIYKYSKIIFLKSCMKQNVLKI